MMREVRHLRKRLGMTQAEVAERLNVDQGTVSRWERGIEEPWPANLAALRDLLIGDERGRFHDLGLGMVRNNLVAACITDPATRLRNVSDLAVLHYRMIHNFDICSQIGVSLERHANDMGSPELWAAAKESGLLRGEVLLLRFFRNVRGKGHVSHYEASFKDGELSYLFSHVAGHFSLPENDESTIEKIDILYADDPTKMVPFFLGKRANQITLSVP